ncbi:DUF2794 domain-containing protein [Oceanibacterium hippocampi]|uniref:DUF2794 domain-containing protein n=1 Tax=Oceanibacterium hippocampi TaxID=745714 RepID=A0A1Y5RDE2_9PROT|nr:DUF2794 domain-containing protein [Oceanibacterium hippocampi]SLN12123.1 hypothetical protein OCH7691_00129 [Oceanibacterium hippocampi]
MSDVLSFDDHPPARPVLANRPGRDLATIFFDRRELRLILDIYGYMVARGEWRDYAIGQHRDSCTFAVFRRTADGALYRIRKEPALANRQGAYSVVSASGQVLKRGRELAQVLKVFDKKRLRVVD